MTRTEAVSRAMTRVLTSASVAGSLSLVPVRVSLARVNSDPGAALLSTPAGVVALNSIAQVRPNRLSTDISEINGERVVVIIANYTGVTLSSVIAGLRNTLQGTSLPPGYSATIGGAYEAQQQSFREFVQVVLIFYMIWKLLPA